MTKFSSNQPVKSTLTADQSLVKWALWLSQKFCPVSKCGVNRVLSCLDPVYNLQPGLVCKRVHTADRTEQNCSVSNIIEDY